MQKINGAYFTSTSSSGKNYKTSSAKTHHCANCITCTHYSTRFSTIHSSLRSSKSFSKSLKRSRQKTRKAIKKSNNCFEKSSQNSSKNSKNKENASTKKFQEKRLKSPKKHSQQLLNRTISTLKNYKNESITSKKTGTSSQPCRNAIPRIPTPLRTHIPAQEIINNRAKDSSTQTIQLFVRPKKRKTPHETKTSPFKNKNAKQEHQNHGLSLVCLKTVTFINNLFSQRCYCYRVVRTWGQTPQNSLNFRCQPRILITNHNQRAKSRAGSSAR